MKDVADIAGHLTPSSLQGELEKLKGKKTGYLPLSHKTQLL